VVFRLPRVIHKAQSPSSRAQDGSVPATPTSLTSILIRAIDHAVVVHGRQRCVAPVKSIGAPSSASLPVMTSRLHEYRRRHSGSVWQCNARRAWSAANTWPPPVASISSYKISGTTRRCLQRDGLSVTRRLLALSGLFQPPPRMSAFRGKADSFSAAQYVR
jgi:hypothetical protein